MTIITLEIMTKINQASLIFLKIWKLLQCKILRKFYHSRNLAKKYIVFPWTPPSPRVVSFRFFSSSYPPPRRRRSLWMTPFSFGQLKKPMLTDFDSGNEPFKFHRKF